MEIKTWDDFVSLTDEEREAYTPDELEQIKQNIRQAEEEEKKKLAAEAAKLKEEAEKAKELAANYKIRAEKAESKIKDGLKETPNTLSQSDLIALIKADVPEEKFDEVLAFAKLKNISVRDALKSSVVKTIIAEYEEEQKTAAATSSSNNRQGTQVISGRDLKEKAEKTGELPASDEDMRKLAASIFGK